MANPLTKQITKNGVTFQLTLTPNTKAGVVDVRLTVDRPNEAAGLASTFRHDAAFTLTRDELTPLVMAFLLGG